MPEVAERPVDARGHRKDYTEEEKDNAMTALAVNSGHLDRTVEMLREAEAPVPRSTLHQWRKDDPERYERAQKKAVPQVKARLADMHEGLVAAAGNIEARMLERLHNELDELATKDLPNATKSLAVVGGIHSEKGLLYRGEPTQIIERDLHSLKRALGKHGFVIEGSAEEEHGAAASDPTSRTQIDQQKQLTS